ncbi:hypothetical protein O181_096917 [Austropuccinia psidii MF-1]|uniref:Uncharacterized protein n=1 Tax=Austropuccinia psidii MF-1 TaxID=1389203 RepID=A0A9Q3J7J6_9BASI|nr:hypothetical protein [Austropuccinia psidii MF-1]
MGIHEEFTYPIHTEDFMENKPQPKLMCILNPMRCSENAKEEDSSTPHHHFDKANTKLNLGTNYFSLDKVKESQVKLYEEIGEEISNIKKKQDQEALSIPINMGENEADGVLLQEYQFSLGRLYQLSAFGE